MRVSVESRVAEFLWIDSETSCEREGEFFVREREGLEREVEMESSDEFVNSSVKVPSLVSVISWEREREVEVERESSS